MWLLLLLTITQEAKSVDHHRRADTLYIPSRPNPSFPWLDLGTACQDPDTPCQESGIHSTGVGTCFPRFLPTTKGSDKPVRSSSRDKQDIRFDITLLEVLCRISTELPARCTPRTSLHSHPRSLPRQSKSVGTSASDSEPSPAERDIASDPFAVMRTRPTATYLDIRPRVVHSALILVSLDVLMLGLLHFTGLFLPAKQ